MSLRCRVRRATRTGWAPDRRRLDAEPVDQRPFVPPSTLPTFAACSEASHHGQAYRARCVPCAGSLLPPCWRWPGSRAIRDHLHPRATGEAPARSALVNLSGRAETRCALAERVSTHGAKRPKSLKGNVPLCGPRSDAKKRPHPHCGIDPRRLLMIRSFVFVARRSGSVAKLHPDGARWFFVRSEERTSQRHSFSP